MAQAVKIIDGGKMVIPAEMRRRMGVERGDTVVVEMTPEGELRVRSLSAAIKQAQTIVRGFVRNRESLAEDLIRERRDASERE
jgi:AbrB family looped-hinge helix DNA binding protein